MKSVGVDYYNNSIQAEVHDQDLKKFLKGVLLKLPKDYAEKDLKAQANFSKAIDNKSQKEYAKKVFENEKDFQSFQQNEEKEFCIEWLAEMQRLIKTRNSSWQKNNQNDSNAQLFPSQQNLHKLMELFGKINPSRRNEVKKSVIAFTEKILQGHMILKESDDPQQYLWDMRTFLAKK